MIVKFEEKISAMLGDFDPAAPPPRIQPVPEGVHRPRWSVMIPSFNCAQYLRQTLESVLAQAPRPEEMQIEVIDDCSTKDDPEAVVREVGKGRVAFYRKDRNGGAISNFNTCIERSQGELVHILHGDDWVLTGFYKHIDELACRHTDCALLATRSFFVDEGSVLTGITNRVAELEKGGRDYGSFIEGPAIQFAGTVIRRSFFERSGGFRCSLVHCADWDMWVRAISQSGGIVSREVLANYRLFEGNDSSRLIKTGDNLLDMLRYLLTASHAVSGYPVEEGLMALHSRAMTQASHMHQIGASDAGAAATNIADSIGALLAKPRKRFSWLGSVINAYFAKSQTGT